MSERPDGTTKRNNRAATGDGTHDLDALAGRLSAVERAVTDGHGPTPSETQNSSNFDGRLSNVETSLADVETRLDELDAATQALRGYVGGVRAVNRDVERRADAALAAVERIETELGRDRVDDILDESSEDRPDSAESDANARPVEDTDGSNTDVDGIAARFRDAL